MHSWWMKPLCAQQIAEKSWQKFLRCNCGLAFVVKKNRFYEFFVKYWLVSHKFNMHFAKSFSNFQQRKFD